METDVRTVVEKISAMDHRVHGKYSAFAVFLNRDLAKLQKDQEDVETEPLYGIVIPCGSFETQAKAEERTAYISAISGAPVVVTCETGEPIPLSYRRCNNSVVYQRDADTSINDLQQKINARRKDVEEINQHRQQEQKERATNPESVHAYIQKIYLCTRQNQMVAQYQDLLGETQKAYDVSISDLKAFEAKNPTFPATWMDIAKPRLKERNELGVFNEMEAWFRGQDIHHKNVI